MNTHQGTGHLGKWPDVFGMVKRVAECIISLIYIATSFKLYNSSTEQSVEQSCVKSCQSAISRHHRGRQVCGALFSDVIIIGKWSLLYTYDITLQLKSKIVLGKPKEISMAVKVPVRMWNDITSP